MKASPQNLSFNGASSSTSKTFIDRTFQAPKKVKNIQTGKQVFAQKSVYAKVSHLEVLEEQVIPFDVYKHMLP